MGSSLSTYRRGSVSGEDPTASKFKASIRPTTGIGLVTDVDETKTNPGFSTRSDPSLSGFLTNGDRHSSVLNSTETGQFLRNQKNLQSMRSSKYSPKIQAPMPNPDELEKRFTKVLVSLSEKFSFI